MTTGTGNGKICAKMASISKCFMFVDVDKEKGNKTGFISKIVFLYDEELHGEGKDLEELFEAAVLCSNKNNVS